MNFLLLNHLHLALVSIHECIVTIKNPHTAVHVEIFAVYHLDVFIVQLPQTGKLGLYYYFELHNYKSALHPPTKTFAYHLIFQMHVPAHQ